MPDAHPRPPQRPVDQPPAPRALHPRQGLRPGAWYACEYPERPPVVDVTAFDPQCPNCSLALEAYRRITGVNHSLDQRTTSGLELTSKVKTDDRLREIRDRRR
jgi:hypothetical protein